uniref:Uncharacterized protein n=1 Tax=Lepeophtheirus salmonis TaxID=72036 RepID=A0A0K2U3W3_LEPSM
MATVLHSTFIVTGFKIIIIITRNVFHVRFLKNNLKEFVQHIKINQIIGFSILRLIIRNTLKEFQDFLE